MEGVAKRANKAYFTYQSNLPNDIHEFIHETDAYRELKHLQAEGIDVTHIGTDLLKEANEFAFGGANRNHHTEDKSFKGETVPMDIDKTDSKVTSRVAVREKGHGMRCGTGSITITDRSTTWRRWKKKCGNFQ